MAIEGIIGKKVGMTQVFAEDGALVPVTVIQAGPCLVVQKKTADKDGYDAVQIGLVEKVSNRRITSPMRGHFEKAGVQPVRTVAEVPYSGDANVGDKVLVDGANVQFSAGARAGAKIGANGKLYATGGYTFGDIDDPYVGAGYQHKLGQNLYAKGEYRHQFIGNFSDFDSFAVGVGFAF